MNWKWHWHADIMSLHLFTIEAAVRSYLLFSFPLLLAAAPSQAQTMFKCVGANDKIVYSDMPCPDKAKVAKEFAVPPPETPEQSQARLAREKERRGRADAEFRERHASRQRSLDYQLSRGNGEGASYIDAPARRSAPPPSMVESDRVPARRAGVK